MLFMTTQQSNPPATPHRGALPGCGLDATLQQPQRSETRGGSGRKKPPKKEEKGREKKAKKKRRCRWWLVVVEVEEMLTFWHYS